MLIIAIVLGSVLIAVTFFPGDTGLRRLTRIFQELLRHREFYALSIFRASFLSSFPCSEDGACFCPMDFVYHLFHLKKERAMSLRVVLLYWSRLQNTWCLKVEQLKYNNNLLIDKTTF